MSSERRSGVKKVDDEYLINLAKRSAEEQKRKEELDLKLQRTSFIRDAFNRLTEDGKLTKEELKEQIELVKAKQQEKE